MSKLRKMSWLGTGLIIFLSLPAVFGQDIGYLLDDDAFASLWWAEGAYKIKRDDPVPKKKSRAVELFCARNEYEPFLLVLRPKKKLDQVRVYVSPLVNSNGYEILPESISICHVDYVNVVVTTDEQGAQGLWPDPLPPYDGPFSACAAENHSFWVTVFVPAEAEAGDYKGRLVLSAIGWQKELPVSLKVWDFVLPAETHLRSSFGLPPGDIQRYHNLETKEELEKVLDLYYQNFRHHRVAPTSPFDIYPMKVKVKRLHWKGGQFISDNPHSGHRALKIRDEVPFANV